MQRLLTHICLGLTSLSILSPTNLKLLSIVFVLDTGEYGGGKGEVGKISFSPGGATLCPISCSLGEGHSACCQLEGSPSMLCYWKVNIQYTAD